MHSPVVEKLLVVDKTLPPDHFYLAKAPSSGQFQVVDKKSGIYISFCCSHFYDNLLFTDMHTSASQNFRGYLSHSVLSLEWAGATLVVVSEG